MRRLLVEKETRASKREQTDVRTVDHAGRLNEVSRGLDRRHRYSKMVEGIYGEPEAADRLLLKTLYLSQMIIAAEKGPLDHWSHVLN